MDISTDTFPAGDCGDEELSEENPWMVNCGYDFAGEVLEHLLPNVVGSEVTEIQEKTEDWMSSGTLRKFDQKEFVDRKVWEWSGLDEFGYIYYPNECLADGTSCKVHIVLHGCG